MIEKLKRAYKAAIRSGKICLVGKKLSAGFDYNFGCYLRVLDEAEWSSFEEKESQFRPQIASKRLNHGDFICKEDISLLMQVHKILHGIFYKNQNFQFVQPNGRHWSVALQRYAARFVMTFRRYDEYSIQSENNTLAYINNQLEFIWKTIGPFFSIKNAATNDWNKVSKEKLVDLWLNRRKKAIAVIRNNGCWPATIIACSTVSQKENYFKSSPKCAIRSEFIQSENRCFDRALARSLVNQSNLFDVEEIAEIVKQCPRWKSCGIDGVY